MEDLLNSFTRKKEYLIKIEIERNHLEIKIKEKEKKLNQIIQENNSLSQLNDRLLEGNEISHELKISFERELSALQSSKSSMILTGQAIESKIQEIQLQLKNEIIKNEDINNQIIHQIQRNQWLENEMIESGEYS